MDTTGQDPPECPGCGQEMEDCGLDGNYREYVCAGDCGVEVLRAATGDHGGMSVESLNRISGFTDDAQE